MDQDKHQNKSDMWNRTNNSKRYTRQSFIEHVRPLTIRDVLLGCDTLVHKELVKGIPVPEEITFQVTMNCKPREVDEREEWQKDMLCIALGPEEASNVDSWDDLTADIVATLSAPWRMQMRMSPFMLEDYIQKVFTRDEFVQDPITLLSVTHKVHDTQIDALENVVAGELRKS